MPYVTPDEKRRRDLVKRDLVQVAADRILDAGVDLSEDGCGSPEDNARRIAEVLFGPAGRSSGVATVYGIDPGAPTSDERARQAALVFINDLIANMPTRPTATTAGFASRLITDKHDVTWERDVNSHGHPFRRYVMRGGWMPDTETATRESVESMGYATRPARAEEETSPRDKRLAVAILTEALEAIENGPLVWRETALDAVALERVRVALRTAAAKRGVIL